MNKFRTSVFFAAMTGAFAALSLRGDTTTLRLDTRKCHLVADSVNVTWNASWIGGDTGAMVVICDNGTEVRRTTGAGEFTHTPSGLGLHELTYTTYRSGVAQEEVYSAVVNKCIFKVSFDANGGEVEPKSKPVTFDATYGELPEPVFEWHAFRRWLLDGEAVTKDTIVATASNHVLVAEWGIGIGGGVWEYPGGDGTITLGAPVSAPLGDVVIPAEIDGRPIAVITDKAFAGNTAITSMTIPDSVTSIGGHAFDGCANLSALIVPYHLRDAVSNMNIPDGCAVDFRLQFGDVDVGAQVFWRVRDGAEWYAMSGDGRSFIRSGAVPANGASPIEASLRGPGRLTFDWRVSANRGDYCRFRLDGVELESITRSTSWETVTVQIPEGVHAVQWTYERGSGAAAGEDAAFLDNVDWRPEVSLALSSDHGTLTPALGAHTFWFGDEVAATVAEPVASGGTRFVCTGWTGSGSVPPGGTTKAVSFTMREDSTLTWNWRKEHWTQISVTGGFCDFESRWVADGTDLAVPISPYTHLYEVELSGDTEGVAVDGVTLRFTADRPRTIHVAVSEVKVSLAVDSEWGSPSPANGVYYHSWGDSVRASVQEPDPANGVQYICKGWTGTGSVPASGTAKTLSFRIEEDSSIRWNWRTNVWVSLSTSGPVAADFAEGWIEKGRTNVAHWTPSAPYYTIALSGDTDGTVLDEEARTLTIPADRPRDIRLAVSELTLADALDAPGILWATDGAASWFPQLAESADGEDAAQSGGVIGDEVSGLEATLTGPGVLSWEWRIDSSRNSGVGVDVFLDGVWLDSFAPSKEWSRETLEIAGEGGHVVRFEYWNTGAAADISDRTFLDSVSWTGARRHYLIRFDANGGEGTMADQVAFVGGRAVLATNAFTRQGWIFAGWATNAFGAAVFADGEGVTDIAAEGETITLYAVWSEWGPRTPYTVRFSANGGEGLMANQTAHVGSGSVLYANTFTRQGYFFVGWALKPTGDATLLDGDSTLELDELKRHTVTLYAVWREWDGGTASAYAVRFDANGGEGTMPKRVYAAGDDVTLPANAFIRAKRFFAGWATEPEGPVVYADGETIEGGFYAANGRTVTLYAVWADSRVVFNANDGEVEGNMAPFYLFAGTEQTLPRGAFTKDGHFILGWALTPDGEATLLDGDSTEGIIAEEGETVSLYAVWHEVTRGGNGLSVKYYDISSSGYSTWTQSEAAMANYFASRPPTIVTNSLAFGETLQSGFQRDLRTYSLYSEYTGLWLDGCSTNRYHGKYANISQNNFAMLYEGYIMVVVGGEYTFGAACDDYIVIYIDGTRVCARSGYDPTKGTITLSDGQHRITIATYEDRSEQGMFVEWKKPGDTSFAPLPQSVLSHAVPMSVSTYAIRFNANGGKGTMPKRVYVAGDNVTLPALGFVRDGWTFVGWATEPDGPVAYADGETIGGGLDAANGETMTLYARWAQGSYTVHFNANGGNGTMADEEFWIGFPDRLPSNAFARTGYSFAGWATSASGEAVYADGESIMDIAAAGARVTLYAKWAANTIVTLDPQGGSGGTASVTATFGRAMPAISIPTRTGYAFGGYWTGPDGSGIQYYTASGASARNWDIASATTLYAKWTANTYTVTLDRDGGTGGSSSVTATYGSAMPSITVPTRAGHAFGGYWTSAEGAGTQYYAADGSSVRDWNRTSATTLYAKWDKIPWRYSINNGKVTILGYELSATANMAIPSSIEGYPVTAIGDNAFQYNGYSSVTIPDSVTSIGEYAFYYCDSLMSVTIGNGVTSIRNYAFHGCIGLTSVTIPDSVTSIGNAAFQDCSGLTSVKIGNGVTSIGANAFEDCSGLKTVTIGNGVTSIGNYAFYGCSGRTAFVVSKGNPAYSSANGLLLSKNGATLILGVNGVVTVPDSVTSIGNYAFQGCSGLRSVTIGKGVTSIGNAAFYCCSGLTSVTIPNSVTSIGSYAFDGCSSLTSVTIPDSVTSIGGSAFENCSGLTSVTIGNGVTSIGTSAFEDCSGLTSVTIGKGVTSIGANAFANCGCFAVAFAKGTTMIPDKAFYCCGGLTSVTIPDSVTSIGEDAFLDCSGLTSVTIPDSVTSIGEDAFLDCSGLTSATIGKGVTSIGNAAFAWCSGLTSLTIPPGVTSIGIWAFEFCTGLKTIRLPERFKGKTEDMYIPSGCKVVFYSTRYTVKFNANGGKLPKGKKMAAQTFTYGTAAKLRKNVFTRKGYVFLGWAKSTGGAVAYANGQSVANLSANGGTVTLYAKWAKATYKVAFYANGGTLPKGKSMAVQTFKYGTAKRLSANKFKKAGYTFKGWAKSKALAKKGTVAYRNKQSVKNLVTTGKTVKLYAVWKKK